MICTVNHIVENLIMGVMMIAFLIFIYKLASRS